MCPGHDLVGMRVSINSSQGNKEVRGKAEAGSEATGYQRLLPKGRLKGTTWQRCFLGRHSGTYL